MIKHTSVDDRVGLRNNRNVQSPPPLDNIDIDEVEAAALQSAVRNSIRTTPGAFAVIPLDIEARNTTAAAAAADTPRSVPSSADPQDGAADNSLGATGEAALSSSSYDGANSIVTDDNGNGGGGNYNGHYLPIDIIAEATLVPSQHEMEEEEVNSAPTEAACELVPIGTNNATPPDEAPPSEMVTSLNHDGLADSSRQQHNANCADNTLPTAVIATAEPMKGMSAVICNRHFRLGWWHFIIVIAIVLLIVLPSALIPQRRNRQQDSTTNWMDDHTNYLQATIEQILIQNSISNAAHSMIHLPHNIKHWIGWPTVVMERMRSNQNQSKGPLRTLYNDTYWHGWRKQYDFLTNTNECEWGVGANNGFNVIDCNNDGFVTLINLWQNQLVGVIPTELVHLRNCTALDFLTNRLSGEVPVEITQMKLDYLNLGYNQLSGTVMPEYGNLVNVSYLMMDFNKLVGTIPPELGKLTQLSGWLSLEGNSLTGTIPQSFVGFTNATWIYLNQNDLTGSAEFLCDALKPVEGYGYTNMNLTSPLLELQVDREKVNCTCCKCCPVKGN
ncbi:leucine-rich repeat domain-containing protein [Skeletonema marinoi]|uniref:Leucine-rich repeat domain-containing protein n=1 Tax=Skeletonema marinoi TaxID=267567 RepID=A0AAD8XVM8_9STRA|nr:leucine-rich repeat domain-containing protein [Skeletonema marinoi]